MFFMFFMLYLNSKTERLKAVLSSISTVCGLKSHSRLSVLLVENRGGWSIKTLEMSLTCWVTFLLNDASCSCAALCLHPTLVFGLNTRWSEPVIDALCNCTLYSQQQLQTAGGLLPDWPASWLKHKRRKAQFLWEKSRDQAAGRPKRQTKEVKSFVNYCTLMYYILLVMRVAPPSNAK